MIHAFFAFFSVVAVGVLLGITIMLSMKRHVAYFITAGQDVFKWMSVVLVAVLISRLGLAFHLLSSGTSRSINSVIFVAAVLGIVWSILRHGR